MSEQLHTPTPWALGNAHDAARNHAICAGSTVIARVCGNGYPIGKGWSASSEADARFIVLAVNSHDALLAALKELDFCFRSPLPEMQTALALIAPALQHARDALKAAGVPS
jgi:hypothetical protein